MVALLVLATFVLFIAVDVILHRDKYQFQIERPRRNEHRAAWMQ